MTNDSDRHPAICLLAVLLALAPACVTTTIPGLPRVAPPPAPASPMAREYHLLVRSQMYSSDDRDLARWNAYMAHLREQKEWDDAAHQAGARSTPGAIPLVAAGASLGHGLARPGWKRTFEDSARRIAEQSGAVAEDGPDSAALLISMSWVDETTALSALSVVGTVLTLGILPCFQDQEVTVRADLFDPTGGHWSATRNVIVRQWSGILGLVLAGSDSGPLSHVGNIDRWLVPLGLATIADLRERRSGTEQDYTPIEPL